mmetsp:Transcript_3716/g.8907  ORF Transcript_3716/g.8907 Transcript_3716/m.8907 type:complete len:367 (-) Transcript_3716:293-1393(-)
MTNALLPANTTSSRLSTLSLPRRLSMPVTSGDLESVSIVTPSPLLLLAVTWPANVTSSSPLPSWSMKMPLLSAPFVSVTVTSSRTIVTGPGKPSRVFSMNTPWPPLVPLTTTCFIAIVNVPSSSSCRRYTPWWSASPSPLSIAVMCSSTNVTSAGSGPLPSRSNQMPPPLLRLVSTRRSVTSMSRGLSSSSLFSFSISMPRSPLSFASTSSMITLNTLSSSSLSTWKPRPVLLLNADLVTFRSNLVPMSLRHATFTPSPTLCEAVTACSATLRSPSPLPVSIPRPRSPVPSNSDSDTSYEELPAVISRKYTPPKPCSVATTFFNVASSSPAVSTRMSTPLPAFAPVATTSRSSTTKFASSSLSKSA